MKLRQTELEKKEPAAAPLYKCSVCENYWPLFLVGDVNACWRCLIWLGLR